MGDDKKIRYKSAEVLKEQKRQQKTESRLQKQWKAVERDFEAKVNPPYGPTLGWQRGDYDLYMIDGPGLHLLFESLAALVRCTLSGEGWDKLSSPQHMALLMAYRAMASHERSASKERFAGSDLGPHVVWRALHTAQTSDESNPPALPAGRRRGRVVTLSEEQALRYYDWVMQWLRWRQNKIRETTFEFRPCHRCKGVVVTATNKPNKRRPRELCWRCHQGRRRPAKKMEPLVIAVDVVLVPESEPETFTVYLQDVPEEDKIP